MKFSKILCTVALLGFSSGMAAGVARADGSDPSVKVNRVPTDPICNAGDPNCLVSGSPIEINLNGTTTINVGGSQDIYYLQVSFAGMTGAQYTCFTDIFTGCFTSFNIDPTQPAGFSVTDIFTGGPGPCQSNGDEIPAGTCPGFLAPGDEITIQGIFPDGTGAITSFVTAPEPSSILLMGLGLIGLFAFGKKRLGSNPAA